MAEHAFGQEFRAFPLKEEKSRLGARRWGSLQCSTLHSQLEDSFSQTETEQSLPEHGKTNFYNAEAKVKQLEHPLSQQEQMMVAQKEDRGIKKQVTIVETPTPILHELEKRRQIDR